MRNLSAKLLATALTLTLLTGPVTAESAMALDKAMVKVWAQTISLLDDEKYDEAKNYLNTALSEAKHDKAKTLRIYICLARLSLETKDPSELKRYIKLAKPLAEELGDRSASIKLQDLEGDYYCKLLKDYKRALPLRRQVAAALEQLLDRADYRQGIYLDKLETVYGKLGQKDKAQKAKAESENRISSAMSEMQRHIKRGWFPARNSTSKHAKVRFKINEEGKPIDVKISQPSGNGEFDSVCVQTVENYRLANYDRWEFDGSATEIEFSFDYNVFNAQGKTGQWVKVDDGDDKQLTATEELQAIITRFTILNDLTGISSDASLSMQYRVFKSLLSLKQIDKANAFISDLQLGANLSPRTKVLLKCESALLLEREKKFADAEALLKEAIESPDFDKLPDEEMKRTFLCAYGDLLYERNQKEEARKIYDRIPPLH